MKLRLCPFWLFNGSTVFFLYSSNPTAAQIVPDATLPINSTVIQQGNTSIIEGGTTAGTNLFHSFKSFSIPTGDNAFFNNATNIQNIFSRVTGSSISNIDGLIKANGTANLFLINPNGIIFGQNAQLNIGGSFIATTASSIRFADGIEFSATNPQNLPLLTINIPIGLQYGTNLGKIVVRGLNHNISQDQKPPNDIIRDNRPSGLQVNKGQTLALVGNEVIFQGGNLTAEEGRIEIGSVDSNSYVTIKSTNSGWVLGYENVPSFQDVTLLKAASLDVSGAASGNIQVQGKRLILKDGSIILAIKTGSSSAGTITIKVSESLEAIGTTTSENIMPSGLLTLVNSKGAGTGGNINIETGQLILRDGAQIGASTRGGGKGGSLTVKASELIEISGTQTDLNYASGLFTNIQPGVMGDGGDLIIETGRLIVRDGGLVGAGTYSAGNSGNLIIKASESIEVSGVRADGQGVSGLLTNVFVPEATGNGGNLTIETQRLILQNGGLVAVGTFGKGNSGNLTVKVSESVEVTGKAPLRNVPSGLYVSALEKAPGEKTTGGAGNLTIETGRLIIRDGATVNATSFSLKKAGELNIKAGSIQIDNLGSINADSQAGGGSIELKSPKITLRNSSITTNAKGGESGGDINIEARFLQLRDRSSITTNASGSNTTGGNINFNLNNGLLIAQENSDITANAEQSRGGKIAIEAEAIFGAVPRTRDELQLLLNTKDTNLIDSKNLLTSDITAISQQGSPQLQGIITINTPDVDPNSGLVELAVDFIDPTRLIATGCPANRGNSFTVTGRGGLPPLPNEPIRPNNTVSVDWVGDIQKETGRNTEVQRSISFSKKNIEIVEATGWIKNNKGQIILIASTPNITTNSNSFTTPSCP